MMAVTYDTSNIFVIFSCGLFAYWIVRRFIRRRKYNLPPGPTRLPVIGSVRTLNHMTLFDHRDKYGDVSYLNLFGRDCVVLNSVETIRDALKGAENSNLFGQRPPTFAKRFLIFDDIIFRSANDKNWKMQRQTLHSLLRQYGEGKAELEKVISDELGVVVRHIADTVGRGIDIDDYLEPSLMNILNILLSGQRIEYKSHQMQELRLGMRLSNYIVSPYVDTVLRAFPWLRHLPFGIGKTYRDVIRIRDEVLSNFLGKDVTRSAKNGKGGIVEDLLSMKERQSWITDDVIKGSIQNIHGAGFITSKCSLYAFFLLMLHYPDVQTKIQDEIDSIVGQGRKPKISDRFDMPYTQAAILELGRFASIVPFPGRSCGVDAQFRGFTIPRESAIIPNLFRVHHDEELWKNPWDFDPGRFLDDSGNLLAADHPSRLNLIPFGMGQRACVGEVFAKTRVFLYITYLLQAFRFKAADTLPSCDPREFVPDFIIAPSAYQLKVECR